jgi:hypothetical protein
VDLLRLRDALEASWSAETSYRGVARPGHPAYGQCYPTARVVQYFFPEAEAALALRRGRAQRYPRRPVDHLGGIGAALTGHASIVSEGCDRANVA